MPAPQSRAATLGPESVIPEKLYFKIGEVSTLVGVAPHVLRYWEREVTAIRPGKTASNQRRYRRKDVELFREIRRLLYEEKYTLAGARKRIANPGRHVVEPGDLQEGAREKTIRPRAKASWDAERDKGAERGLHSAQRERLNRVRLGLLELIEMAGEQS